jgi:hypothetical protein
MRLERSAAAIHHRSSMEARETMNRTKTVAVLCIVLGAFVAALGCACGGESTATPPPATAANAPGSQAADPPASAPASAKDGGGGW